MLSDCGRLLEIILPPMKAETVGELVRALTCDRSTVAEAVEPREFVVREILP